MAAGSAKQTNKNRRTNTDRQTNKQTSKQIPPVYAVTQDSGRHDEFCIANADEVTAEREGT